MADEKVAARKKGLHGWRAAVAVFGCGSLAAFGVFGVIVLVLNVVLSTAATGVPGAEREATVQQTGEPIAHLEPGEMDLCVQDVQHTYDQYDPHYQSDNYEDPALQGNEEDRTVSDHCSWEITPRGDSGGLEPWVLTYAYEAVISTTGSDSPQEVASSRYSELVAGHESNELDLLASGDADLSDRSFFHYGTDPEGAYVYYLTGQTKSTVYVIKFESPAVNGEVPVRRFRNEADHVASFVEPGLGVLVPD
ncbi:hypothetical protein [Nocardiopsis aegyptia]|uniref:DUF3558 domain-containing protein n=1 Tax=Nocardiopsis aegyptia TaxID=220378 RepID=A0A7Z0J9G7_9ACTN|nr:hypothetical protein [Nocardiopsis aegyptia]NYJ34173.1 hypothetical protein [Nocardiopsis aegyptia]